MFIRRKATRNAILIGPLSGVMTGQSKCMQVLSNNIEEAYSIDSGGEGIPTTKKIKLLTKGSVRLFFELVKNTNTVIVISVSRSCLGFLKDLPFLLIMNLFKVDYLIHLHGNDLELLENNRFTRLMYRYYYSRSKYIIIPTINMKKYIPMVLHNKLYEIPNFVDLNDEENPESNNRSITLGYFSNLISEKGIFDAIDVYTEITKTNDKVNFRIAGNMLLNECDEAKFSKYVSKDSNVEYLGSIQSNVVSEYLSGIDILLFPSSYKTEAFPLVLLEAIRMRTAIVLYSHNGIENILPNKTHQAAEGYSKIALKNLTEKLISDKKLLKKIKMDNYIASNNYTKQKYIRRFKDVIIVD